jgi:hypothetical protein
MIDMQKATASKTCTYWCQKMRIASPLRTKFILNIELK